MERFTRSPLRGWRWLWSFLGAVVGGSGIYILGDWPLAKWSIDAVMIVFPIVILLFGLLMGYVGVFASDAQLLKFNRILRRWA
jgi:hypothetical protein